jgi:hypothetical protein
MTLFSLRKMFALLLTVSLASCGGGSDTTYPIAGTVTGLAYGTLVLTAAGQTLNVTPNVTGTTVNAVTYSFPKTLGYGDPFLVALGANPAHQSCLVGQSTADSAGHTATINVAVSCSINTQYVSGYVYGLVGDGLQLINGSLNGTIALTKTIVDTAATTEAAAKAAALALTPPSTVYARTPSFTFPAVAYNQAYGVTILNQPTGQTCTVTNGAGKIADAQVLDIVVNCVNNPT